MSSRFILASSVAALVAGCGGGGGGGPLPAAGNPPAAAGNSPLAGGNPPPIVSVQQSPFPVQVGQVGPIDPTNPKQQPFACVTQLVSGLGKPQPVVDNQNGIGFPVKDANGNIIGYSADCGLPTRVDYYYRSTSDAAAPNTPPMHPYDPKNPATDVATINVNGSNVKYIVRFERGTINRFLYSIAILSPNPDANNPNGIDFSAWNKDLVFTLQGATGTGHAQGSGGGSTEGIDNPYSGGTMMSKLLEQGYAVAFSSGTATSTTYNLALTGQTAHMLKQQFVAAYAKPRFTFAVGASGGAVQQMVYVQNDPGLLDGAIPVQNFPDMVTQTTPVGDCELLTYYFDVLDAKVNGTGAVNPKWTSWAKRSWITGFSGNDSFTQAPVLGKRNAAILPGTSTGVSTGSDVCMQQWRGAVPEFLDPYWGQVVAYGNTSILGKQGIASTFWGYVNDLITVFTGSPTAQPVANPPNLFDNEGVQYGLAALNAGNITPDEFLNLNAHVGGSVRPENFLPEGFPYIGNGSNTSDWDPWSARNATAAAHATTTDVAPRMVASASDLAAMQMAYKSGQVFRGNVNLPIIHIEPYLEATLDEHATKEPFVTRQRMLAAKGNADNQVIWMINTNNVKQTWDNTGAFVNMALQAETNWLLAGSRPSSVEDSCFDGNSNVIASGAHVWDGQVSADGKQVLADTVNGGACTKVYPIASNSRIAAGAPVTSSIFKCALKPVVTALHDGTYGNTSFSVSQEQRLEQIFSTGVCDYSKPDQALPAGM